MHWIRYDGTDFASKMVYHSLNKDHILVSSTMTDSSTALVLMHDQATQGMFLCTFDFAEDTQLCYNSPDVFGIWTNQMTVKWVSGSAYIGGTLPYEFSATIEKNIFAVYAGIEAAEPDSYFYYDYYLDYAAVADASVLDASLV